MTKSQYIVKHWVLFLFLCGANHFVKVGALQETVAAVILDFIDYFRSHTFILLKENDDIEFIKLKKTINEKRNVLTSVTSVGQFRHLMEHGERPGGNVAVICIHTSETLLSTLSELSHKGDMTHYSWLIVSPKELVIEQFSTFKLPFNVNFLTAEMKSAEQFAVNELFETGSLLHKAPLGLWTRSNGLRMTQVNLYTRRSNLHNTTLKLVVYKQDPCSTASFAEGSHTVMECIHLQIWYLIAERMNFSTSYVIMPTLSRFRQVLDVHKDVTASLEPYALAPHDAPIHTFFWPTIRSQSEVFTRYSGQDVGWETYIGPFSSGIWMLTGLWVIVSWCTLKLADRFRRQDTVADTWISFSAFCNQGVPCLPRRFSPRLVVVLILMVSGVLVPAYSAALTSFLAIPQDKKPFTDLEGLSKNRDYKFSSRQSFDISSFLLRDPSPVTQQLVKFSLLPFNERPVNEVEGVSRMCTGKFSFADVMYSVVALKPKCKYYKLNNPLFVIHSSMPLSRTTPYKVLFNRYSRVIRFSGVLQLMKNRSMLKYLLFYRQALMEYKSITIEDTTTLFVILCGGLVTSWLLLIVELYNGSALNCNARIARGREMKEKHQHMYPR